MDAPPKRHFRHDDDADFRRATPTGFMHLKDSQREVDRDGERRQAFKCRCAMRQCLTGLFIFKRCFALIHFRTLHGAPEYQSRFIFASFSAMPFTFFKITATEADSQLMTRYYKFSPDDAISQASDDC